MTVFLICAYLYAGLCVSLPLIDFENMAHKDNLILALICIIAWPLVPVAKLLGYV